jgi:NADPH:quinone reductase-like Zn-dependent oxidoreductase
MLRITEDEVMIRSRRVGICHSDWELLAGRYIIPISYLVTPGHQWVGEVVETGKNVTGLTRGDRLVGEGVIQTAAASIERPPHPPWGHYAPGDDRSAWMASFLSLIAR